jgi:hypothetical protein
MAEQANGCKGQHPTGGIDRFLRSRVDLLRHLHVRDWSRLNRTKALSGVALIVAVTTSACQAAPATRDAPPPASFYPEIPPPGDAPTGSEAVAPSTQCTSPRGNGLQDVDPDDTPEKSWPRPADGAKVTVYFETGGLSDRYERLVREATAIWSISPACIQAVAVEECMGGGNCVSVEEEFSSRDRGTDGEFRGRGAGQYRTGGTITLYTEPLDRSSDNGALATVVHEMGHAFGLVHRTGRDVVMNETTDDRTNPVPDAVDFANLAVLYGAPAPARN